MKAQTLALIICLAFVNNYFVSASESLNQRVIIIGAGPSGIAAASKLYENGFTNVTILEAENRIGGRIYTTKLGDYVVDLGGQWVHGEKGNVAYSLASPLGLLEKSNEPYGNLELEFSDSQGNALSDDVTEKISAFYDTYIMNASNYNSNYESVGEYLEKMFDEDFKDNPEILRDKKKYLHHLELSVEGGDPADSWYNISTTSLFEECEGDLMTNWKERGYSTILDILMKRYPDPQKELPVLNNTVLNCEVKSIDYSSRDAPVTIATTDGRMFKADHVIVTVSLGVLKAKHTDLFNPPLPTDKISAIEGFGFGKAGKVYLLYEKPFWNVADGKVLYNFFYWNEEERKSIEADPEKSWILGVVGALSVEHKPNLLCLWVSGPYVVDMEAQPEDKVFHHASENIERFLGKKHNVTKPVAMLRTQWYTNPHFRGVYSYRTVETQRKNLTRDKIEGSLDDLKILFAGEATSVRRYSTVDGAIGSGWKTAERLLKIYKLVAADT